MGEHWICLGKLYVLNFGQNKRCWATISSCSPMHIIRMLCLRWSGNGFIPYIKEERRALKCKRRVYNRVIVKRGRRERAGLIRSPEQRTLLPWTVLQKLSFLSHKNELTFSKLINKIYLELIFFFGLFVSDCGPRCSYGWKIAGNFLYCRNLTSPLNVIKCAPTTTRRL